MSIIYKPEGVAAEYAVYAVIFFNGCSNSVMWKSSFRKLAKEYGIELTENVNLYGREEIDRTEIEGRANACDFV